VAFSPTAHAWRRRPGRNVADMDAALGKESRVVKRASAGFGALPTAAMARGWQRPAGRSGPTLGRDLRRRSEALKGHTGAAASVAFGPDRLRLISGGLEERFRLWDAAGKETRAPSRVIRRWSAVGVPPRCKRLVSAAGTGRFASGTAPG